MTLLSSGQHRDQQKDPVLLTPRKLGVSLWTEPDAASVSTDSSVGVR